MDGATSISASSLGRILGQNGGRQRQQLTILGREPNPYSSTARTETVECLLPDGTRRRVFCKYGSPHKTRGTRGAVRYEHEVYVRILQTVSSSTSACYGLSSDVGADWLCLVLEQIDDHLPLSTTIRSAGGRDNEPDRLLKVAEWLARFHGTNGIETADHEFLCRYDEDYFLQVAKRAADVVQGLSLQDDSFRRILDTFEGRVASLAESRATVVHGEFYPSNILIQGQRVCPVDWETAAVGPGEIDFASLTEGWSRETVQLCEAAYTGARWGDEVPPGFHQRVAAARTYFHLLWIGQAVTSDIVRDRLDKLGWDAQASGWLESS